jgi:hypothetical protein
MSETCGTCAHYMPDGNCLLQGDFYARSTSPACVAHDRRDGHSGREIAAKWYMAREWGVNGTGLWKGHTENYGDGFRRMLSDLLSCAHELSAFVELNEDTAPLYDKLGKLVTEAMLVGVGPDEDFEDWLERWGSYIDGRLGIEVD